MAIRRRIFSAACFTAVLAALAATPLIAAQAPSTAQRAELRVGTEEGDIKMADNRGLQASIDYVASLGGGTVRIGPGRYLMRNALTLRDNVDIVGVPGKTILAACDGCQSRLAADGDCNERQITLADPAGFRVGDGVSVLDQRAGSGFAVTTATLTARVDANTFRISAPLYLDYMVANNACAKLVFPVVGGWKAKNVAIEGLTIDGNRAKTQSLDGCRGGGIYLFDCEAITIRNCVVRQYNGDGISFQTSERVTVEDCVTENNAGIGLHPGSGSQRPVLRGNRSTGNGADGLFVCWRVRHGLFENNELRANKQSGISIGHKDSDNLFRNNTSTANAGAGLLFRNEDEPMGAHRNVFEGNRFLDNGTGGQGDLAKAAIVIRGHHHDLVFRRNVIGNSQAGAAAIGILASKHANGLKSEENQFLNVKAEVETAK
jgi:parallel beta-helix repeat protein